jgi:hypothetical protein
VTHGDRLLVVIVALAAALAWPATLMATSSRADVARVNGPSGTSVLALRPDREIAVEGLDGPLTLELRDGGVRVTGSPCPDRLCIRQGVVSRVGSAIVCVPSGVTVRIGGDDGALDAVVR